jgi:hypothetical protein
MLLILRPLATVVREMFSLKSNQMVEGSVCIGLRASCKVCARPAKWPALRSASNVVRPLSYSRPHQAGTITPTALPQNSRLFDLAGRQLWPNPVETNRLAAEMAEATLRMVSSGDRDACTPNWWKAVGRRQAAAAEEAELQGKRFAEIKIAQEKRENEEAAARWNAAHGTRQN